MASNITTLVEKAKQGDADAFSTLYQMYYPKMKGICINILKEDKAVVDNLVQDAFILAFVSLKDLKNTRRFSQWLTSITTNLALKYQEKDKRYNFISLSDIEEEFGIALNKDGILVYMVNKPNYFWISVWLLEIKPMKLVLSFRLTTKI